MGESHEKGGKTDHHATHQNPEKGGTEKTRKKKQSCEKSCDKEF